jgi:tetratricopeptide (TPR) repeat protein
MMRVLAGTLLVLVLSSVTSMVAAQSDDERAHGHFLAGRSYMDQGRYEDAAEQFQESYRLSERPELLLNAALAFERAAMFGEAAEVLDRWLSVTPEDHPDRRTVTTRAESLRERAESGQTEQVDEGELEALVDESEAETDSSLADAAAASDGGDGGGGIGGLGIIGIITAGVGVALGAAAIGTGVAAHGTYGDLMDSCPGGACSPDRQSDIDSGKSLATVSTVLTPIAVVLAAVGVTLLILDLSSDSGESESAQARLGISAAPDQVAVSIDGSF